MRILDEDISLKKNLLTSLRRHWFLWSVLLVTALLDFASTLNFMSQYGIYVEQNMVVRWLALHLGVVPGVLIGKSLQILAAAALTALSPKYARPILLLLVGLNVLAFLVNVFLLPRLPA
jgi:hypothetical protein